MRNGIITAVLLLLCPVLFAQEALDNAAVVKLVKAGLSEDLIVTTINPSPGKSHFGEWPDRAEEGGCHR